MHGGAGEARNGLAWEVICSCKASFELYFFYILTCSLLVIQSPLVIQSQQEVVRRWRRTAWRAERAI